MKVVTKNHWPTSGASSKPHRRLGVEAIIGSQIIAHVCNGNWERFSEAKLELEDPMQRSHPLKMVLDVGGGNQLGAELGLVQVHLLLCWREKINP